MKHDIFTLIRQLQEEADKYDAEFKGYEAACVNGMLKSYFKSMHDGLPDDHFLKEYIPEQLAKELDDLKQRAVMKKLES